MKYIHKKTQVVIDTACVISSENWIPLKEIKKPKTSGRKKQPKEKQGD